MRIFPKTLSASFIFAGLTLAGGLRLEVGNPVASPEAKEKHAVLVARITACQSPEKTNITATAEGIVDGSRRTIPLPLIPLSTPGTFAVTREWPTQGNWAVKMTATNPEYKDYAAGVLVPMQQDTFDGAGVKHFYHAPTSAEVDAVLSSKSQVVAHR
jgi:hypothetical protein